MKAAHNKRKKKENNTEITLKNTFQVFKNENEDNEQETIGTIITQEKKEKKPRVEITGSVPGVNLHIPIKLGKEKKKSSALIDSGTDTNIAQTAKVPAECVIGPKTRAVCAASPSIPLTYQGNTSIQFTINDHEYEEPFKVVDEVASELILGMKFLHKHDAIISCGKGWIKLKDGNIIKFDKRYLESLKEDAVNTIPVKVVVTDPDGVEIKMSDKLKPDERSKAIKLLTKFKHLFSTKDDQISKAKTEPYRLHLTDEIPVQLRPYNGSYRERKEVREFLQSLETAGVITKSRSEYCSPAFIKMKENKKVRLLVDYKELNKKIIDDHNTVPRIDVIMETLKSAKYFSTMDLAHGYYQFPLHEDSQKYTAFRLDSTMLYEFKRLPQGLKVSAAATCRAMHDIFEDILFNGMTAYIDDLCAYGDDFDTQLKNLETVLTRLDKHNFKLNTKKCEFFEQETTLLGHIIGNGKVRPNIKAVKKFLDLKPPKTVRDVRSLISSFGFYRKYMDNFVQTTKPIMDLISETDKKDPKEKIEWTPECQKVFEKIKTQITSPPVLAIFNPDHKTYLQTDASSYAIGAVLSQQDPITKEIKPVAFYSKKLPQRKRHLGSYDLELIAIAKALRHFRQYLYMQPVTVLTDHKNLTTPKITENSLLFPARIQRITDVLSQFDITFEHIKGKDNCIPDLLSRGPDFEKINAILTMMNTLREDSEYEIINPTMAVIEQNKLATAQDEDKEIRGIKTVLEDGELDENYTNEEASRCRKLARRHIIGQDNILCLKKFNRGKLLSLPIIPPSLREDLIKEVHDKPMKGNHTGETRTYLKLANIVSWPNMRKEIIDYVKSCEKCQKIKPANVKYGKILHNTSEPQLMQKVCTDVLGPLKVNGQETFILTMIDSFSKFMFMKAVKSVNTGTVTTLLNEIIAGYPAPKKLFTDQATYFMSNDLKAYCEEHGIELEHAITYTPSTNGLIERPNQWISNAVKALLADRKIASTILNNTKLVQRAWNTCPNPSLENMSPHYIMFGQEDNYLQNKYGIPPQTNINREEELRLLTEFREKIPAILRKNFEKYSEYYNRARKEITLNVGDKVMLQKPFPKKLENKFTGPHEILRVMGPSTFLIHNDKGEEQKIHISKIKKYYERGN